MSNLVKKIAEYGVSLEDLGVYYRAYSINEALELLSMMEQEKRVVLGGDVFCLFPDGINFNYDNWYFNVNNELSKDENIRYSCQKAREYITNYPMRENIYFSIVSKLIEECS